MRIACLVAPLTLLLGCGSSPEPTMPPEASQPATEAPAQEPAPPDVHQVAVSASSVGLVTIKNGDVEVPASFESLTGTVSLDLADLNRSTADLTLDLASWNSGVELRDERMKDVFFQVGDKATTVGFALQGISNPSGPLNDIGSTVTGTAKGKLDWRGLPMELEVPVSIQRTAADAFVVKTPEPFTVSIEALGMSEPLAKLIEVCQHESVADTVQVSLDLTLGTAPAAETPAAETTAAETTAAEAPTPGAEAPAQPSEE